MKRLRAGLTAFNTLITGAIVLGMTILCLILSEKSARTESFRNFSGQLATAAAYLQSQDRLSLGWLEQMETAGQLHTAILDGGAPLFSVGLDPARDGTAAEAARRMARQDYGLPEKNQLFTCAFSMTDQGKAYFAGVAKIPKGRGALEITMLCPLDSLEQSFARLRLAAGLGAVLAVGLLGGFSWSFTGRLLRPIEESRREQTQFIAAASHELRTPLTAILSAAAAMERAEGEKQRVFSQVIDREGRRMGRLITDMLTLASADSGGWRLRPRPMEPEIAALDVYETYAPQAREKGLKLLLELPEKLPTITADPDRISQALAILLDNALSYTPAPGRITLGAQAFGKKLRFTVADTGPGVPDGEKQQIFRRFHRSEQARSDRAHFGLGLSIAAEIAARHQGRLWVEDAPQGGAVFVLELPLR